MKHKKGILFFTILFSFSAFGQTEKVKGSLLTTDTADLVILNIYPELFPNVSVVFKAESKKGEPLWNLTKEKMIVKENSQNCEVISLEQISKNKPINLGIVIDHSGSMATDFFQLFDQNGNSLFSLDSNFKPIFPKSYIAPIDNAKLAVKKFISTFNIQKDFISIVGFSDIVDKKLPLTQNIAQMNQLVDAMKADNSTALYDAMITSIDEIRKAVGVKVLVVLTDGQDNSSKAKWNDVVDKAKKENIPIYIIGFGDVNIDTLTLMANDSKGKFYFTKSANSLQTVYAEISKQVQAFYNLVYSSTNFSSVDSNRRIELSFDIDNIYLFTKAESSIFPTELVEFVIKKEKERQYILYGGIALGVLISTGTLLFYFQRKKRDKNEPVIKKLFPNPTDGIINLDYESESGQLYIIGFDGLFKKSIEINGTETQFDLTNLKEGTYIAYIKAGEQQSNAIKFIIQK